MTAELTRARPHRFARFIPWIVVAIFLGGFGMLADEVMEGDTLTFDKAVLALFRTPGNLADPIGPTWFEEAVRDITSLGSFSVLGLLSLIVIAFLLLSNKRQTAWYFIIAIVGGTIISTVLKELFNRQRPDFEAVARVFSASFPSGHATTSAVVYLTVGVMLAQAAESRWLKRFWIGLAIFITFVVGLSRLYLGVHYPTDVMAGWLLGSAWAILCWTGAELILKRHGDQSTD